ncbi:hypothetical protein [Streptomyces sp. NPDC088915]|uniref:hypothetical protein n=1 Tax=Streptomyces sp. NPDC088915 TaxID=3365912 RepID=UPI0037F5D6A3
MANGRQQIRQADFPDAVMVPDSVVNDPDVSPNDLGIYVRFVHMTEMFHGPYDLDEMVRQMTLGRTGQRADSNEAAVRSALQRLVDAGHLMLAPAGP